MAIVRKDNKEISYISFISSSNTTARFMNIEPLTLPALAD
jgi:hypothetical protein